MNKTLINFWLDCLLLLLFCVLGWASAVLHFLFPVGPAALEWSLWGWDFWQWRDFQFGTLCVFAAAILLHIMLHWTWVIGVVAKRFRKTKRPPNRSLDTIYGVVLLLALLHVLGIAFAAAMFAMEGPN